MRMHRWLRKEEKERNRVHFAKKKSFSGHCPKAEQSQSKARTPSTLTVDRQAKIEGTLTSLFSLKCTIVLVWC